VPSFLDTNVFVYAFDRSHPEKRAVALELLEDADAEFVTSAQVLSEFYVTTTRKLDPPLTPSSALEAIEHIRRLPIVAVDDRLVAAAAATAGSASLSLWDGLIVEAAARAGCDELLTEDLNAGQIIAGVQVRNPFV
jgi:predicted nucleic acid-binding protein